MRVIRPPRPVAPVLNEGDKSFTTRIIRTAVNLGRSWLTGVLLILVWILI